MVLHVTFKLTFDSNPPTDGLGVTEVCPHTTVTRTNPDVQPTQDSNPLHEEGWGGGGESTVMWSYTYVITISMAQSNPSPGGPLQYGLAYCNNVTNQS